MISVYSVHDTQALTTLNIELSQSTEESYSSTENRSAFPETQFMTHQIPEK